MLTQLVSAKATQRELSNEILDACRRAYDPNAIASVLCSKFNEVNDRVKPGVLELLSIIIPEADEYMGVAINMRSFLQKLGVMSAARTPLNQHLLGAIERTVTSMFHFDEKVFIAALSSLPSDPQMAIKALIVGTRTCVRIEEMVAAHLKGKKFGYAKGSNFPLPTTAADKVNSPPATNGGSATKGRGTVAWAEGGTNNDHNSNPQRTPSPSGTSVPPGAAPGTSGGSRGNGSTPGTDPVMKYMVRPPLSEEKMSTDWMKETPEILSMLSLNSTVQEQYSAMQRMVQLARQNEPEVWSKYFGQILLSLLEGIGQSNMHPNQISPTNSGAGMLSNDNISAMKHLYLQGVRALLKYQPMYFSDYVEIVVDRLLQCSKDANYEIVHTAERALENLVMALEAERCLKVMLTYLTRKATEPEILLSCIRTLQKFIGRIPSGVLLANLGIITPPLVQCFSSPNVDMRKSVVFALVQVYFVLGDKLMPYLTGLNAAQLKLITIYVEREQKQRGPGVGSMAVGSVGSSEALENSLRP